MALGYDHGIEAQVGSSKKITRGCKSDDTVSFSGFYKLAFCSNRLPCVLKETVSRDFCLRFYIKHILLALLNFFIFYFVK
jgi:hypothetical protein